MGFGRKKKKRWKMILICFLAIFIIFSLWVTIFWYHNQKMNLIAAEYTARIEYLENERKEKIKMVYVASRPLLCGTVLTQNDVHRSSMMTSIDTKKYMSEQDFGKALTTDVGEGMPIFDEQLFGIDVSKDIREHELSMLLLPSNIAKNQYIDIRIGFPNGEDYIVLSKKKIIDANLSNNTLWLWLDEQEILTLSSAIVDAYLHKGTKIYTLTYVKPELQTKAVATYPVNEDVLNLLENDPNIIELAKDKLSTNARVLLEQKLSQMSHDDLQLVHSGLAKEEHQREQSITSVEDENVINEDKKLQESLPIQKVSDELDASHLKQNISEDSSNVQAEKEENNNGSDEKNSGFF